MIVLMSDNSENAAVGHGGERDMARDIGASSIASHIDLFFDELHRIDVAYSDYARRAGVSDNVMCILDYHKDHDGASQRAICEYTLLPRQTVNNVIASFVAHGFVELGDTEGDRRVKTVRFTPAGRRYCNSLIAPSRAAEYRTMSELPDELRSALLKGMGVYGRVFRKQMHDISV